MNDNNFKTRSIRVCFFNIKLMLGVFDSGVGGLTVLKSLLKELPDYDYIYLGDNARAPYGNKNKEEIYKYTVEAVSFLFKKNCRLVVVACNTASALALRRLQQEWLPKNYPNRRVLGVVRPMAEALAGLKNISETGIIGTKATIKSKIYNQELLMLKSDKKIIARATPLLVPLIESDWQDEKEITEILEKYLQPFKKIKIKNLVLGCTHYPFLKKEICQIMGKDCKIYESGEITAKALKSYLKRHQELGIKKSLKPKLKFYATGKIDIFKVLGERFLDKKIKHILRVVLFLSLPRRG